MKRYGIESTKKTNAESDSIAVGSFVRCTKMAPFPVGVVKAIGPELDNPHNGDRFAYVQLINWEVVPVLKSTLVLLKRNSW